MSYNRTNLRRSMFGGIAMSVVMAAAGSAFAAAAPISTATGTEGADVEAVVVNVERDAAAAAAPAKASLLETQPQSIITHRFIEQAAPESGDYTTAVLIAPSMAGISTNGGGVGETNKISLRGFSDGQFNVTYDGIAYGDTNDPTHHPASFFPGSTIGAAVVDRGPGAAGDLGQANYGGAIHFFSPHVDDTLGVSQKATYGTFNTQSYVTTLQSGAISQLHGTKVLLNFDERTSDGQNTYSSGLAQNQLIKIISPLRENLTLTLFAAHNYTKFYQSDAAVGTTAAQLALYGKNFALNNIPTDEHYYKYNFQTKQTDFEYADLKWAVDKTLDVENQAYTNFYSNKTTSVNDVGGLVGGPNTSGPSSNGKKLGLAATDIAGYDKGNRYRVVGDILRINKDFDIGTLRVGGLIESSWTDRHNRLLDLTTGQKDLKYTAPYLSNLKTEEHSSWFQYQVFADFEYRPTEDITITPGIKFVDFTRKIDAVMENSVQGAARGPVNGRNEYGDTLYFLTANYRITPYWSMYVQGATGFLIPALSTLQVGNLNLNTLRPQKSINEQIGTVYTRGALTFDADVYHISLSNAQVAGPTACQCYVNAGSLTYSGVEAQGAYTFPIGLTLFANGSINTAKDETAMINVAKTPKWTDAAGVIYQSGPLFATLTYKQVGDQLAGDPKNTLLQAYSTVDASVSYDFGHFKAKLAGFNLADDRKAISYDGTYTTYQVGQQVQLTLQAKF